MNIFGTNINHEKLDIRNKDIPKKRFCKSLTLLEWQCYCVKNKTVANMFQYSYGWYYGW